jgi:hypothetical protein
VEAKAIRLGGAKMKSKIRLRIDGFLILLLIAVLASCGPSMGDRQRADEAALAMNTFRSLAKIQAAIEVGVNYQTYGGLLIDARAQVNEAHLLLPDVDLMKRFETTIDAYTDASKIWDRKIKRISSFGAEQGSLIDSDAEPFKTLAAKYSISIKAETYQGFTSHTFDADGAMQTIWAKATTELLSAWAPVQQKLKPGK